MASTSSSTTTARRRWVEIARFDDTAWAKAIEQNLMYVVRMVREAVPSMKRARRRQHPQHHRDFGDPADTRILVVRRHLVGRDRLSRRRCRSRSRQYASTSTRSAPDTSTRRGCRRCSPQVASRPRWCRRGCRGDSDEAHRHDRRHREPGRVAGLAEGSYITGTAIQVDGGLLRAVR